MHYDKQKIADSAGSRALAKAQSRLKSHGLPLIHSEYKTNGMSPPFCHEAIDFSARPAQFPVGSTVKLRVTTNIRLSESAAPTAEMMGIPVMGSKTAEVADPVGAVR
jgi:hypothetical protein